MLLRGGRAGGGGGGGRGDRGEKGTCRSGRNVGKVEIEGRASRADLRLGQ